MPNASISEPSHSFGKVMSNGAPDAFNWFARYNSTGGASWNNNSGWSSAATSVNGAPGAECTWFGVGCDVGGNHVVFLGLAGNNLVGRIPALGNLTALQFLDLGSNDLTNSIRSPAGLTSLASVFLDHNDLTGSIPSLTGLSARRFAYFNSNQLSGSVPSLAGLTSLQSFYVFLNQLTRAMALPPSPSALVGANRTCARTSCSRRATRPPTRHGTSRRDRRRCSASLAGCRARASTSATRSCSQPARRGC